MSRSTKVPSAVAGLAALLEGAPRLAARLPEAQYLGPCLVQAPGAWTRAGPTWLHPRLGWIVAGPGVDSWGTTRGLAELATATTAKPSWHAVGICVSPTPNLVFAVTRTALTSPSLAEVAALAAEAEALVAARDPSPTP